jgi:hypothetical protein
MPPPSHEAMRNSSGAAKSRHTGSAANTASLGSDGQAFDLHADLVAVEHVVGIKELNEIASGALQPDIARS